MSRAAGGQGPQGKAFGSCESQGQAADQSAQAAAPQKGPVAPAQAPLPILIVNGPITYAVDGKQFVVTISGQSIVAFALRD